MTDTELRQSVADEIVKVGTVIKVRPQICSFLSEGHFYARVDKINCFDLKTVQPYCSSVPLSMVCSIQFGDEEIRRPVIHAEDILEIIELEVPPHFIHKSTGNASFLSYTDLIGEEDF
jgi:hypothetical protein